MEEVVVSLGFSQLSGLLKSWPEKTRCLIVSTPSAFDRYGAQLSHELEKANWQVESFLFPCGEEAKDLFWAQSCWKAMQEAGLHRRSVMVSLGGGALTDVAGFAASCYMRGIDLIVVPTTLLGMIDAAIGGKNGINFGDLKNAIGTFHTPKILYANIECLSSLPDREFCAGLAEAIKYGFISDPALISFLEAQMDRLLQRQLGPLSELIRRCIACKQEVVKQDPKDTNLRAILNFGHTFGHALERAIGPTLLHGEAVAIGMNEAAKLGVQLRVTPPEIAKRLKALCTQAKLPTDRPPQIAMNDLIPWIRRDKKNTQDQLTFVLLRELGKAEVFGDIPEEQVVYG